MRTIENDLAGVCLPRTGFEPPGDRAGAQFAQVEDVVAEGARRDAEELRDRGDGAVRVGQQVAGGLDDFLGSDGGAPADTAAGTGGGQALGGADVAGGCGGLSGRSCDY